MRISNFIRRKSCCNFELFNLKECRKQSSYFKGFPAVKVIKFRAYAFPNSIAEKAVEQLEEHYEVNAAEKAK